jgi:hypothetical protein
MSEPRRVGEHMFAIEVSKEHEALSAELGTAIKQWLDKAKNSGMQFHEAAMVVTQFAGITAAPLFYMQPEHYERLGDMCRQNFVLGTERALNDLKDSAEAEQVRDEFNAKHSDKH